MGSLGLSLLAVLTLTASAPVQKEAEERARAEVSELLASLCPGRCVLLSVEARVEDERVGEISPGFEAVAPGTKVPTLQRLTVVVLADATLPQDFRARLKGFLAQRLKPLGVPVNASVEPLLLPVLTPPPAGVAPVASLPEPPHEALAPVASAPPEATPPWMALVAPALAVLALLSVALVGIGAMVAGKGGRPAATERAAPLAPAPPVSAPLRTPSRARRLERALAEERSLRNAVVRDALTRSEVELVTIWTRELGEGLLSDLAGDAALAPALAELSARLSEGDADSDEGERALLELEGRLLSQRLARAAEPAERAFTFLEGVPLERVVEACRALSSQSRAIAIRFAPAHLRGGALGRLTAAEREEFAEHCLLEPATSLTAARAVAEELRLRTLETGGGLGQAEHALSELLDGLSRSEQDSMLARLQGKRPGALGGYFSESALLSADPRALAAALLQLPRPLAVVYLAGADLQVRARLLDAAPQKVRRELEQEIALAARPPAEQFLAARRELLAAVRHEAKHLASEPAPVRLASGG